MHEPDVTLTDYGLAIECAIFACLLCRRGRGPLATWGVVFFASASAAPLLGGTVHGFFLDEGGLAQILLWRATLLAIGVTALAGWNIGAYLVFKAAVARTIGFVAMAEFGLYVLVVVFLQDEFWVAIANYLPAALLLLISTALASVWTGSATLRAAPLGLLLTFVAALVQQLRVSLHPVYFNHNALYHVIQAGALFLIFLAARELVMIPAPVRRDRC